ncbi:MAG: histidine kinase [Candidatus Anammoxibacter sp.]
MKIASAMLEVVHEGLIIEDCGLQILDYGSDDMNKQDIPVAQASLPVNNSETGSPRRAQPETSTFRFLHDRVQQAAYTLISNEHKKDAHLKIGRLMLKNMDKHGFEEKMFDIVNHLNYGRELIIDRKERNELARFNLTVGRRAKASTAYEDALKHLITGIELLNPAHIGKLRGNGLESSWQDQYELTLSLHVEGAEAAYLAGNSSQMEELIDAVEKHAKTLLDRIKAYEIKINFYVSQQMLTQVVDTTIKTLKQLGVHLPEKPGTLNIISAIVKCKLAMLGKNIEDLEHLPKMTDPYKLAAMRISAIFASAVYITVPKMIPILMSKVFLLTLKYGNSPYSAYAYAAHGLILCGVVGNFDSGYRFGRLALKMLDRFTTKELDSKICLMFNIFVKHWKDHIKETPDNFLKGYQVGLEIGDLEYASLCAVYYCVYLFLNGKELKLVENKMAEFSDVIKKVNQERILNYLKLHRQLTLNLMNYAEDRRRLNGEICSDKEMLSIFEKSNDKTMTGLVYIFNAMLCYIFGDYRQAVKNSLAAEEYLESIMASIYVVIHTFYHSLILLALYPGAQKSEQKQYLKRAVRNQKKMKKWAYHAPMNFLHKYYLVEAEIARVLGKHSKAMDLYDKAIDLAKENEYLNEQALCSELAARFFYEIGKEKIAMAYMAEAHYCYQKWGAMAKVKDLEEKYPQLLDERPVKTKTFNASAVGTVHEITSDALDLTTVIKASQAISGEIVLDRLLTKLIKILIKNAGAQKGFLILEKDDMLFIEAEGSIYSAKVTVLESIPVDSNPDIPASIINYVKRTKEKVILNDAVKEGMFMADPYVLKNKPASILCAPVLRQANLVGILYLENRIASNAFTPERLDMLEMLSSQAAISLEIARLYAELRYEVVERGKAEEVLHKLAGKVLDAHEDERKRLSRELHDGLGQSLIAIKFNLQKANRTANRRLENSLEDLVGEMSNAINELRDISSGLRPVFLDKMGIANTLKFYSEKIAESSGIYVNIKTEVDTRHSPVLEENLFRIFQEAMNNVVKHSNAKNIMITLQYSGPLFVMEIKDDGKGFDYSRQSSECDGIGLFTIKERVNIIRGNLTINSKKGEGTTIRIEAPYK